MSRPRVAHSGPFFVVIFLRPHALPLFSVLGRSAKIEAILQHDIIAADIAPARRAHRLYTLALTASEDEWRALEGILKSKAFAARLLRAYVDVREEEVRRRSFPVLVKAGLWRPCSTLNSHLPRHSQVSAGEAWRTYAGERHSQGTWPRVKCFPDCDRTNSHSCYFV